MERFVDLLENPAVTDLCFNGHDQLWIDQGLGLNRDLGDSFFKSETEFRNFVLEQISLSGKTWDAKLPFLDTVFFNSHRAHVAFPPLSPQGITLSLRRLPPKKIKSQTEVQSEAELRWKESSVPFQILKKAILAHDSIIFAGGTGSGKTTLLNDLISFVPERERVIGLEDTPEMAPAHPQFVSLLSRVANADGFGAVTLRDLLKQTLRMRPDRILIGECRGDEVLELLQALNTGHRGTLGTIHANSARDALRRLELLALLAAKGQIPSLLIKELIAHGIQKLVFLNRDQGVRRIESIISIEGLEREIIFSRPVFSRAEEGSNAPFLPELRKENAKVYPRG